MDVGELENVVHLMFAVSVFLIVNPSKWREMEYIEAIILTLASMSLVLSTRRLLTPPAKSEARAAGAEKPTLRDSSDPENFAAFRTPEGSWKSEEALKKTSKEDKVEPPKAEFPDGHPFATGVHILQARYGSGQADVDVTSIVQDMVDPQEGLFIPADLVMNELFGDPAWFR